jgi:hypothetical protein
LVEHVIGNDEVAGSIPADGSSKIIFKSFELEKSSFFDMIRFALHSFGKVVPP